MVKACWCHDTFKRKAPVDGYMSSTSSSAALPSPASSAATLPSHEAADERPTPNAVQTARIYNKHWERSRFLFNSAGEESPAVFAWLWAGAGSKAAGVYLLKYGCQPLVVD